MGRSFHILRAAFHRPESPIYRSVQGAMWVLIVLSIGLFWLELAVERLPEPWASVFHVVDVLTLWLFGLDVTLRVLTYTPPKLKVFSGSTAWRVRTHVLGRLRYLFTPLVLIDVITVLALVPALRALRALRLLRLLAGLRFFRYSSPILGVLRSFTESWLLYASSMGFLLGTVALGGVSIFIIEGNLNDNINSLADGMWWALVTITTVGFGDVTPVTTAGRVVASVVMIAGMFSLALFAGIVSTTILNVMFRLREEAFRMSSHVNHIVVCGYDDGSRMLLDTLLEEIHGAEGELLLFAPGERPPGVPDEFTWIPGDPTKEGELDKVKLSCARAVIVVGARRRSIQEADASTLLTLFTIRSYLAKQPSVKDRARRLHVTAEILDQENVAHAYAAGADEVIETTRLGFSMMAHAVFAPGSAQIMRALASASDASVFVGKSPFGDPHSFGQAVEEVRRRHGVAVLGLRGADGKVELNPASDQTVGAGAALVYLARQPVLDEA